MVTDKYLINVSLINLHPLQSWSSIWIFAFRCINISSLKINNPFWEAVVDWNGMTPTLFRCIGWCVPLCDLYNGSSCLLWLGFMCLMPQCSMCVFLKTHCSDSSHTRSRVFLHTNPSLKVRLLGVFTLILKYLTSMFCYSMNFRNKSVEWVFQWLTLEDSHWLNTGSVPADRVRRVFFLFVWFVIICIAV